MAKNKNQSEPETPGYEEPAFDPSSVVKAKQLVYPTLKVEAGSTIFIRPLEPMFVGQKLENDEDGDKQKRGPATILKVRVLHAGDANPLNGKDAQIVLNKLLKGILAEQFTDDGYVGKVLRIVKSQTKKKGKNGEYHTFDCDIMQEKSA